MLRASSLSEADKDFLGSWGEKQVVDRFTREKVMVPKCPLQGQAWGYKISGTTEEDKNALVQELGRGHPFLLPTLPNEQFVLCVSDKDVAMAQGFVAKAIETGKEQRYRNSVKGNLVSIRLKMLHRETNKLWTREQKKENPDGEKITPAQVVNIESHFGEECGYEMAKDGKTYLVFKPGDENFVKRNLTDSIKVSTLKTLGFAAFAVPEVFAEQPWHDRIWIELGMEPRRRPTMDMAVLESMSARRKEPKVSFTPSPSRSEYNRGYERSRPHRPYSDTKSNSDRDRGYMDLSDLRSHPRTYEPRSDSRSDRNADYMSYVSREMEHRRNRRDQGRLCAWCMNITCIVYNTLTWAWPTFIRAWPTFAWAWPTSLSKNTTVIDLPVIEIGWQLSKQIIKCAQTFCYHVLLAVCLAAMISHIQAIIFMIANAEIKQTKTIRAFWLHLMICNQLVFCPPACMNCHEMIRKKILALTQSKTSDESHILWISAVKSESLMQYLWQLWHPPPPPSYRDSEGCIQVVRADSRVVGDLYRLRECVGWNKGVQR